MDYKEEDIYLVLNFKENIEQKFFTRPNLFFKMVNLNSERPYVQIGQHVFNGTFEDNVLGTNLFFEEQSEPRPTNLFEKQTPIHLKYLGKTPKTLTLRWQKVPDEIIDVDADDLLELEFNENYDVVLDKIENGTLDINSIIKRPRSEMPNVQWVEKKEKEVSPEPMEVSEEEKAEFIKPVEQLEEKPVVNQSSMKSKYELLKDLVQKPVVAPEYYEKSNLENFTCNSDFAILKELYLKSLDYNRISLILDGKNIEDFVDLKESINDGIILNKDVSRLTDRDRQLLISIKNFDNLTIPTKIVLLVEHLREEKAELGKMKDDLLKIKDEFGRTPKDKYKLLKSLIKDLQYYLFLRIRENRLNSKE